jgi:nucleoside-diphosphate-sugar epimerase
MKILVTGGGGYIGSVLVPKLLKKGYEVTVIDDFRYHQTPLLEHCSNKKLHVIRGDVRDKNLIKGQLKNVDAIFPLACLTGAPVCNADPIGAKTINFEAVKMIVENKSKNQLLIFPSTQSVYGHQTEICTEKTKPLPLSLYSKLKVDTENTIGESENWILFRLATVFGVSPRMRRDLLVNDFTYRALYDKSTLLFEPHFRRDYLYVGDVAEAFIFCLENFSKLKEEVYNIKLSGVNLTKKELCEEIKKQIPQFVFLEAAFAKDPDKRDYVVSSEKIEKTGFKATTSIQQGITELIKAYQIAKIDAYSYI